MDDADSIRQTIKACTAILVLTISATGYTVASTDEGFDPTMILLAFMALSVGYLITLFLLSGQAAVRNSDTGGGT